MAGNLNRLLHEKFVLDFAARTCMAVTSDLGVLRFVGEHAELRILPYAGSRTEELSSPGAR